VARPDCDGSKYPLFYASDMTDQSVGDESPLEVPTGSEGRLRWDVPELCAVAVLGATTLLILAGLAAGVVASTASEPSLGSSSGELLAGSALQRGAEWANPLLGFALLGVMLLCWWRTTTWTEVIETTVDTEVIDEALGHMWRGHQVGVWVQWALVLNFVGAVAFLVGVVLTESGVPGEASVSWSVYLFSGGSALAVLAVSCCGLLTGSQLNGRYWSAYDHAELNSSPSSDQ
jgi:hypothetical protein